MKILWRVVLIEFKLNKWPGVWLRLSVPGSSERLGGRSGELTESSNSMVKFLQHTTGSMMRIIYKCLQSESSVYKIYLPSLVTFLCMYFNDDLLRLYVIGDYLNMYVNGFVHIWNLSIYTLLEMQFLLASKLITSKNLI